MAKAIATCVCKECGKEFEVSKVYSTRKAADGFAEWAHEHVTVCPECRSAQKAAAIDAKSAYMPQLSGTEKQIAWARKLRVEFVAKLDAIAKDELIAENGEPHAEGLRIYDLAKADLLNAHTDAGWWIDNRSVADIKWFWGELLNPAVAKYSNTTELVEETTESINANDNKEMDDMTANNIAEIIAYYNDNDKLADKHTRLAAECEAAGNMSGAEKHETAARICEARIDGLLSCLRMLGHEVVFEGNSITIKA